MILLALNAVLLLSVVFDDQPEPELEPDDEEEVLLVVASYFDDQVFM